MIDKKYCEYGCGQEAVFQMKNGKWCCAEMHAKCPQIRRKNTESQKGQKRHGGAYSTSHGFKKGNIPWSTGRKMSKECCDKISSKLRERHGQASTLEKETNRRSKIREATRLNIYGNYGGYKRGSGRGKHGWYKGIWCDSSWELAWVIFHLEHGIRFERNKDRFEYYWQGKIHKYLPDFKMGNEQCLTNI